MTIEIKVPEFPESVTDGTLVIWYKSPGDAVARDEILADIETDKVVFEVPSPEAGILEKVLVDANAVVTAGQVVALLATDGVAANAASQQREQPSPAEWETLLTPSAKKMIAERGLDGSAIAGSGKGGRVLKEDVQHYLARQVEPPAATTVKAAPVVAAAETPTASGRVEKRVPMTRLRARIAERLLEAQHSAALLTTFNEVNMAPVMALRERYRDAFEKRHGVRLGFMSFFIKAAVEALRRFPEVNASIDGDDLVYHGFFDVGIAVSSPRGLVVPLMRDADLISMSEMEKRIADFGSRAKSGTLALDELIGGTFSITNGGVFGSLLSTPIVNPPQSAILGLHKIEKRPVVVDDEIVIRPMMYLALTYDHRVIDGREAVQFLVTIKEMLEDPSRLLLDV